MDISKPNGRVIRNGQTNRLRVCCECGDRIRSGSIANQRNQNTYLLIEGKLGSGLVHRNCLIVIQKRYKKLEGK